MRVLKFLIAAAVLSYTNLSLAGKYRPIYYYFTNGARLAIIDGEIHYMPPTGNLALKEKLFLLAKKKSFFFPKALLKLERARLIQF